MSSQRRPKIQIRPKLSLTPSVSAPSRNTRSSLNVSECSQSSSSQLQTVVASPVMQMSITDESVSLDNSHDRDINDDTIADKRIKKTTVKDQNKSKKVSYDIANDHSCEPILDETDNRQTEENVQKKNVIQSKHNVNEIEMQFNKSENEREKRIVPSKATKKKIGKSKAASDRSKMTIKDFVLFNPPSKRQKGEQNTNQVTDNDTNEQQIKDDESEKETDDVENDLAPRVKVGTDGELILDEDSVIIKRKKKYNDTPTIVENSRNLNGSARYSSFRKGVNGKKPRWTQTDTARFYSALKLIGTDFTLMAKLFFKDSRTRIDLKNKYKKEERINKYLIDEALTGPGTEFIDFEFDVDSFIGDSPDDDSGDSHEESPDKKS